METAHITQQLLSKAADAETQLISSLPDLIKLATNDKLRKILIEHYQETEDQLARIKTICEELGFEGNQEEDEVMRTLLQNNQHMLDKADSENDILITLVIGCIKVEHAEMSMYSALKPLIKNCDNPKLVTHIEDSLIEEQNAAVKLEKLLEELVKA